jgi:hypothetical protein
LSGLIAGPGLEVFDGETGALLSKLIGYSEAYPLALFTGADGKARIVTQNRTSYGSDVPTMFMWDADTLESLPVDGSRATFARFRHCYVDPSNGKTRFLMGGNERDGPFEIRDADTLEVIGSVPPLGEWLPLTQCRQ